ncbi:hypothetical protein SRHO_G00178080 [Serrasalmus rhombeus]
MIFLIITLHLISGPVGCFDVIGYSGGSIKIYCQHHLYGSNDKYICEMKQNQCVTKIVTQGQKRWNQKERFSLCDYYGYNFTGRLEMILRPLSLQDAGSYQCGETGGWNHTVNLTVIRDPCCLGPKTVTGYLGMTVTISCSYPEEFEKKTKYLYKLQREHFTSVIQTSETQRGRFSISDDRSSKVVSVRISDVREDDGGVYYCGVWSHGMLVSYESLFTEIQLQVTDFSVIISVSVCVALLLIGGSALMVYQRRHKQTRGSTSSLNSGNKENKAISHSASDYEEIRDTRAAPLYSMVQLPAGLSDHPNTVYTTTW